MSERRLPAWAPTAGVALALAVLVAWSFAERWAMLSESPFPVGVDGYFYPIQLRSLLETGELQYPASPLAFWLMLPFAAVTDPMTGAKLGAAVLGALIALPAYGVGARLGRGRGAGLIAAVLATTSAGSAYLTIEFVKNGIGLGVALTALWLVLRALEAPSRGRLAGAALGVLAAALSHKMAAGLVVAIAVPAAIAEAAGRGALRGRRLVYAIGLVAVLVIAGAGLGLAFPQRFLSPGDAALIEEMWSGQAHWDAPALAAPRVTLVFGREALIGGLLALVAALALGRRVRRWFAALALVRRVRRWITALALVQQAQRWIAARVGELARRAAPRPAPGPLPVAEVRSSAAASTRRGAAGERTAAWVIVGLALVIALPWLAVDDPQGLGFRLRIAAFVPMALCGAIAAGRLVPPLLAAIDSIARSSPSAAPERARSIASPSAAPEPARQIARGSWYPYRELVLAGLAVVLALRSPGDRNEGRISTHPALVTGALAMTGKLPPGDTAIVPERHIAFMIAWYTRAQVSLRPERIPAERRWRVMPLAFIGLDSPLDRALLAARTQPGLVPPLGLHPRHPNGLVLVAEPTWQWALDSLPPEVRARWAAWPTI